MNLFVLIQFLELLTVIIGSIYYAKYSSSFLRYFLYWLWVVTAIEFAIWGLKHAGVRFQNNFIYNVITSIQYIYLFLLYYKTMKTVRYRKWVFSFLVLFVGAVIVNFLWVQKLTVTAPFHSYTFALGAILCIITISLFMAEILNSEKVLYFRRYLIFWISIGLFLFYAGIIPFTISLNFLPVLSTDSLAIILFALNLVMYSCFIAGFMLSQKYTD